MKKRRVMMGMLTMAPWLVADVSLETLQKEVNALGAQIGDLLNDLAPASSLTQQMDAIVAPFLNAVGITPLGGATGSKKDPDTLTNSQLQEYQALFFKYASQNAPTGPTYNYYKFCGLFLSLLQAKNAFELDLADLTGEGVNIEALQPADITVAIAQDARSFLAIYQALQLFLATPAGAFAPALPSAVSEGYKEFVEYAQAIMRAKQQPTPPPVITTADRYIMQHFGDGVLSSLKPEAMQASVKAFKATYASSDAFFAEYQIWAAYVPTRYWQLQLLEGTPHAAKTFMFSYLNGFKTAYAAYTSPQQNQRGPRQPYAAQLADIALEFSVSYALARVQVQNEAATLSL